MKRNHRIGGRRERKLFFLFILFWFFFFLNIFSYYCRRFYCCCSILAEAIRELFFAQSVKVLIPLHSVPFRSVPFRPVQYGLVLAKQWQKVYKRHSIVSAECGNILPFLWLWQLQSAAAYSTLFTITVHCWHYVGTQWWGQQGVGGSLVSVEYTSLLYTHWQVYDCSAVIWLWTLHSSSTVLYGYYYDALMMWSVNLIYW